MESLKQPSNYRFRSTEGLVLVDITLISLFATLEIAIRDLYLC